MHTACSAGGHGEKEKGPTRPAQSNNRCETQGGADWHDVGCRAVGLFMETRLELKFCEASWLLSMLCGSINFQSPFVLLNARQILPT